MSGWNTGGTSGGGGGGGCATYAASGEFEAATLLETLNGGKTGSSGCYLAVLPINLPLREETATGAKFMNFASGLTLTSGFGANAVEMQTERSIVSQRASGTQSITMGTSNEASGSDSVAIGRTNKAKGLRSAAIGAENEAHRDDGHAIGSKNYTFAKHGVVMGYANRSGRSYPVEDDGVAVGRSNHALMQASMAIGIMNNVSTPGNIADGTGVISGDPQTVATYVGINSITMGIGNEAQELRNVAVGFKNVSGAPLYGGGSFDAVAVGVQNIAYGLRSLAVGYKSEARSYGAVAIGDRALNRINDSINVAGPFVVRKDDGEPLTDAARVFAGAESVVFTDEINLAVIADHSIALPAAGGAHIFISEVGVILTELTGVVTTQPTVRFGITGTPEKLITNVLTTELTAVFKREIYEILLSDDGETTFLFGVSAAAVAGTSMSGRAYVKFMMVEDE